MKTKVLRRYKRNKLTSWLMAVGGIILALRGLYRIFYMPSEFGMSLLYKQPMVLNGTFPFFLGLGMFLIGIYRIMHKQQVFEDQLKLEEEIEEEKKKKARQALGYKE